MACKICGSNAINHGHHGRDGTEPNWCDVCYWREKAKRLLEREKGLREAIEPALMNLDCIEQSFAGNLDTRLLGLTTARKYLRDALEENK